MPDLDKTVESIIRSLQKINVPDCDIEIIDQNLKLSFYLKIPKYSKEKYEMDLHAAAEKILNS